MMKNQILMLAVFLISSVVALAQTTPEIKCGTMVYLQKQKDSDTSLEARMLLQEKQIQQWIDQNSGHNYRTAINIPVVFHVVYHADSQNVSNQRLIEQIALSNRDYSGQNTHSMGAFSSSLKSNTGIQFCLAQKAPDGTATNGIERRYTTNDSFSFDNSVKFYSSVGLDAWDPTIYLNIWVCNIGSYWAGYAQFPTSGITNTYGAVINDICVGTSGNHPNRNNGGTTTHEVGHCFNLYHTWGDDNGACTGTDYCADVPNEANSTSGGHTGVLTDACSPSSPGIMYMNFMDYSSDSTEANFTPNQTTRMQALFASPSGLLLSLANSTAGSAPTACETPTALKATSITNTSAVLGWTAMYGATGYNIKYKKTATTKWTSTTSSTNSKSLSGLNKNTPYEFQVQTVCSSGNNNYSTSKVFQTTNTRNSETGIDELITSIEFNLFPNPAKGQATISYYLKNAENAEISLFDITGRIIKSEKIISKQGENNYMLDLNMVSKGLYFVELSVTGQTSIVRKLSVE